MLKLDIRLSAVASFVEKTEVLADVGSDHGYLPVYLLQNSVIKRAVVTDINAGPLNNARRTAAKYSLSEHCIFLLGNGLVPLDGQKADTITICGMGGELISKILHDSPETAKAADRLILQPMNNRKVLMKYLSENGFFVNDEGIVRDKNFFYHIISVSYSAKSENIKHSSFDYEFSPLLIERKDNTMYEYLSYKLDVAKKINDNITANKGSYGLSENIERMNAITERLSRYET